MKAVKMNGLHIPKYFWWLFDWLQVSKSQNRKHFFKPRKWNAWKYRSIVYQWWFFRIRALGFQYFKNSIPQLQLIHFLNLSYNHVLSYNITNRNRDFNVSNPLVHIIILIKQVQLNRCLEVLIKFRFHTLGSNLRELNLVASNMKNPKIKTCIGIVFFYFIFKILKRNML